MYYDAAITYCYTSYEYDACLDVDIVCDLYIEIDDMAFEGTCDEVAAELGWDTGDGGNGGTECDTDWTYESCWDAFSAEMAPELQGIVTDCWMDYEVDTCSGEFVYCWMELEVDGGWQEGFCDSVDEWLDFGGPIDPGCEPGEQRLEEEVLDCKVEIEFAGFYIEGLESCVYTQVIDACSGEEFSCDGEVVINGESTLGTCDELIDIIFNSDTGAECAADEVREVTEEGDCLEDILAAGMFTDGLESCSYTLVYDECQDQEVSCDVTFVEYGEVMQMTCAEVEDYFWMGEVDDCSEEYWEDCLYLDEYVAGLESCELYSQYDWCEDIETVCEISAVVNGTLFEDTCDTFANQFEVPDENCVEFETYDCMDMVPETMAEDVLSCTVEEAYDYCFWTEVSCFVTLDYQGEFLVDTCDNIVEMFGITPDPDDDCSGFEEGECMTIFTEFEAMGLEECYYWYDWDYCDLNDVYEDCWAEIVVNGTSHEGNCDEIERHFTNGTNDTLPEDCVQWGEPINCFDDFDGLVPGLQSCEFWEVMDCNGDWQCKVRGQIYGEFIEGPCDEITDLFFGNGTFNDTGNCTTEQLGPIDCMDEFSAEELLLLDSCEYWLEYDTCTFEDYACYVEVTYDG